MDFDALLTLSQNGKVFANPRRIALLKAIEETGSISQGAKLAGISYKAAFDAVKDMNSRAETPVVDSEKGGKGGGGALLTHQGKRLVQMYELLDHIQSMGLQALNDDNVPLHSLLGVMSKLSLQTSARNQLFGSITAIENHDLHDLVHIGLAGGEAVIATVTHGSTLRLNLTIGKDVVALIKGPAITVTRQRTNHSELNQLGGTLTSIESDGHSTELFIKISDENDICALVSQTQEEDATFSIGMEVYATFHSSQVIIATMT
ncbi:molybdenum-dependent transcriptional regulator [Photobacterium sanctipauli]|uniref:Molybdenum-dependent transcriptional regulator n=1 Tax=Photobacterium sanctipauli TaxID=1342794 RepID=A0A2T3NWQ2_9GAMM|nr:TOBE domain-containing protein [Photobacterium sanctipauli]PSW20662.1 molybdenum-dependent transcriptional regulator [Photobacterium sanctipauli]